jgi:hypothetical protein
MDKRVGHQHRVGSHIRFTQSSTKDSVFPRKDIGWISLGHAAPWSLTIGALVLVPTEGPIIIS